MQDSNYLVLVRFLLLLAMPMGRLRRVWLLVRGAHRECE